MVNLVVFFYYKNLTISCYHFYLFSARDHEHRVHENRVEDLKSVVEQQHSVVEHMEAVHEAQRVEWRNALADKDEQIQTLRNQVWRIEVCVCWVGTWVGMCVLWGTLYPSPYEYSATLVCVCVC